MDFNKYHKYRKLYHKYRKLYKSNTCLTFVLFDYTLE